MTHPTEDTADFDKSSGASKRGGASERSGDSLGELFRTIVYALLIALIFRTVLFQPFFIPSGSMKSTLLIGDYLFVSKYSYGYSKYSLPWGSRIPDSIMSGRVLAAEPERGDIIVFRNPQRIKEDYIKRLIGLPGDRVQVTDGRLSINGEPVELTRIEDFVEPFDASRSGKQRCNEGPRLDDGADCTKGRYVETLPGGVSHIVLNVEGVLMPTDNTREFVVPDGYYFFMGDNRDNSVDSRIGLGLVPAELLIGRAEFVLLSSEGALWEFWNWRGERFFQAIE